MLVHLADTHDFDSVGGGDFISYQMDRLIRRASYRACLFAGFMLREKRVGNAQLNG
jgi:hypothetical protein